MIFFLRVSLFLLGVPLLYGDSFSSRKKDLVREKLRLIPPEDQKTLTEFLRGMLCQGDFTATLLGDKPAFMTGWVRWETKNRNSKARDFSFLTYKGWQLWRKYADVLPNDRFSFVNQGYRRGCFVLWFVKEFQKGPLDTFLQQRVHNLKTHETTGLLLGYPKKDVEDFCKSTRVSTTLQFFPYEEGAVLLGHAIPMTSSELLDGYPEDLVEASRFFEDPPDVLPWTTLDPFFPTIPFYYQFFSEEGWEQKIADLYNSEHLLEDFLTLMVKE